MRIVAPAMSLKVPLLSILLLIVPAGITLADQFGDFTYVDTGSEITITAYPTTATGPVQIPSSIVGKPVTAIGNSAFQSCVGITALEIPGSVTSLGTRAFYNCKLLTSVVLPPGLTLIPDELLSRCAALTSVNIPTGVTAIGENAFSYSLLAQIDIPESVTSIGKWAFFQTNLSSVTIPSGVTVIRQGMFSYCANLTEVNLPDGLLEVGMFGFSSCPALETVKMPDSVTTLGFGVFARCWGLTSFRFPAGVTSVPSQFFNDCEKLESVTIPNGITAIGSSAFDQCAELKVVTVGAGVTSIGDGAFSSCSKLAILHFLGRAPMKGVNLFAAGKTPVSYYHTGAMGFQNWSPSQNIGAITPISTWLIANIQPYNSSLATDSNNDGVNLLTAYAFGLDPRKNLAGSLPKPTVTPQGLGLNFFAAADGVTYRAEASLDLASWSAQGGVLSPPDADGKRTASCPPEVGTYMRVAVEY